MQEHSNSTRPTDCEGHNCTEVKSITYVVSKLLKATEELINSQHDPGSITWSISQASAYCDAFTESHPSIKVQTLIGGIDANAEALLAASRWKQDNDS